jgi:hypothetical protein
MDLARKLFETGRSHALSSNLLYRSAIIDGKDRGIEDPEHFAFNGPYSLSINYLLGLGLELMLKAAIVAWGGPSDDKSLKEIGHDLIKALNSAEAAGFHSTAPHLRDIVNVLQAPFREHWLRYGRPDEFLLPADFSQLVSTLELLDDEIRARLGA